MKVGIVYYSLEGNTAYVAEQILQYMNADTLRLEPVKEYPTGKVSKFFWGGKSAIFGESPNLVPYVFDVAAYDVILLGTPVWAGKIVPPLRTFIKENDLAHKKVAFFACSSGGDAEKCFCKLKEALSDSELIAELSLIDPKAKKKAEDMKRIEAFCKAITVG